MSVSFSSLTGFDSTVDRLFDRLTEVGGFTGLFAIFGVLILCGFGLPLPEDIPLIAAGYLSWSGEFGPLAAIVAGLVGVLVGDTIMFLLGKKIGAKLLNSRIVMAITTPERIRKVEKYYEQYGHKLIFVGRFLPGLRSPIFFVGGASGVPLLRFILIDGFAALISVPVWVLLGYFFGDRIDYLLHKVHVLKHWTGYAVAIIGAFILLYYIRKIRQSRRSVAFNEAGEGPQPPLARDSAQS